MFPIGHRIPLARMASHKGRCLSINWGMVSATTTSRAPKGWEYGTSSEIAITNRASIIEVRLNPGGAKLNSHRPNSGTAKAVRVLSLGCRGIAHDDLEKLTANTQRCWAILLIATSGEEKGAGSGSSMELTLRKSKASISGIARG